MGYKTKTCEICGREYEPGGPRQKFCPECKTSATAPNVNALRLAIMKQAKKDGKLGRMVENGAAAQLFPGTDQDYLVRLSRANLTPEEKEILKQPLGPLMAAEKENNMTTNYKECRDAWEALMDGEEVLAVDLNAEMVYRLGDRKVREIVEIIGREDVLLYQRKGE